MNILQARLHVRECGRELAEQGADRCNWDNINALPDWYAAQDILGFAAAICCAQDAFDERWLELACGDEEGD